MKSKSKHAAFSVTQSFDLKEEWIFDSGATSHMCRRKNILVDSKDVFQKINVANNAESSVVATGSVKLDADVVGESCQLAMSNVLCVPDLALNLLSVSKICKNGYSVLFNENSCEVRSKDDEQVAVGSQVGGLYKLCLVEKQFACAAKDDADMALWHRRMGHSLRSLWANGECFDRQQQVHVDVHR